MKKNGYIIAQITETDGLPKITIFREWGYRKCGCGICGLFFSSHMETLDHFLHFHKNGTKIIRRKPYYA